MCDDLDLDMLHDPPDMPALDRLDRQLATAERSARAAGVALVRNQRNRLSLLVVHATVALLVAPLLVVSPRVVVYGPAFEVLAWVPGWPWGAAAGLFAGGAILLPATLARVVRLELLGLALIAWWYAVMAVGLAVPLLGGRDGALWPPLVYGHLCVVMVVHMRTLIRLYGWR